MSTKLRILKEAAKLFAEKGFNETPTSEIAEAADIAHGTVFYHFAAKKDILKEIYLNLVDELYSAVEKSLKESNTGLENLMEMLKVTFAFMDNNKAEATVLYRDFPQQIYEDEDMCNDFKNNNKRNIKTIQGTIEKGIKDGSIRGDANPENNAKIIRAMIIGTVRMRLKDPSYFVLPIECLQDFCKNSLMNRGDK